jgi:hypothetical protein
MHDSRPGAELTQAVRAISGEVAVNNAICELTGTESAPMPVVPRDSHLTLSGSPPGTGGKPLRAAVKRRKLVRNYAYHSFRNHCISAYKMDRLG